MPWTHAQLSAALDDLEARMPALIAEYPDDADFWPAFAGIADDITDNAGDEGRWVQGRIDCILASHGLIPGDNEGEPCA